MRYLFVIIIQFISKNINLFSQFSFCFIQETTLSQQQLLPENNPAIYLGINCNQPQYLMQQQNLLESQLPPVFILQPEESSFSLNKKQLSNLAYSYNWSLQLNDASFMAAPTSCFKHVGFVLFLLYICLILCIKFLYSFIGTNG